MKKLLISFLLIGLFSGCATGRMHGPSEQAAEFNYYNGHAEEAIAQFEALAQKRDKNFALLSNQLGSIYLSQGDYEHAQTSFMNAFYLMNDVGAFSELEGKATSLTGAESNKAYKGDPYERMYNSLYVGLLLYNKGDLENARAAFKNGILAGSDKTEDLYKSNEALLYLFASRMEFLTGNESMGKDLYDQAQDAFFRASGINQDIVSREQIHRNDLKDLQQEFNKICTNNGKSSCDENQLDVHEKQKIEGLNLRMSALKLQIQEEQKTRGLNDSSIDTSFMKSFINKENNVFLVIQTGQGPIKTRTGQYGEKAVFYGDDHSVSGLSIVVDGQSINTVPVVGDVFYQATTRGGRKMDYLLQGKAQFKNASASVAQGMFVASSEVSQQRGNESAAGVLALIGLGSAVMSAVTNPSADIRHWSLLPNKIWVYPLKLSAGIHTFNVSAIGTVSLLSKKLEFKINGSKDEVFFVR